MKSIIFAKRITKEVLRDPIIYIFCLGFPVLMLSMFALINIYAEQAAFELKSLVPGVTMFSFTFVMLIVSMQVSKDRTSFLLKRLYSSPMKARHFVFGYALPCVVIGILQAFVCIACGALFGVILDQPYFGFGAAMLLVLSQLPMLIICVFGGILLGSCLNDKAAPGVTSALITVSGLLGGCWMPLDVMGGLEKFCRFLPFYPSVYWGRIITGASHTQTTSAVTLYAWDNVAALGIIPIAIFLIAAVVGSFLTFRAQMQEK